MKFSKYLTLLCASLLASCVHPPMNDVVDHLIDPIVLLSKEITELKVTTNIWPKDAEQLVKTKQYFRELGSDIQILSVDDIGDATYKIKIEKYSYKNITFSEQILTIKAQKHEEVKIETSD